MSLSRKDVEHVASLARLGLSSEEIDQMQETLSSILGHIDVLSQVDTDAIPPTAQVVGLENVLREDIVRDSLPQDVVMKMTPGSRAGFISVSEVMAGNGDGESA